MRPELPLEMGDIQPGDAPVNFRIGVCKACGRHGLIGRYSGKCAGYRAATIRTGLMQVPELRSVKCEIIALRKDKANRKLIQYERPKFVPFTKEADNDTTLSD